METITLTYKNLHPDIQAIIQNDLIKDSRIDKDSEILIEESDVFLLLKKEGSEFPESINLSNIYFKNSNRNNKFYYYFKGLRYLAKNSNISISDLDSDIAEFLSFDHSDLDDEIVDMLFGHSDNSILNSIYNADEVYVYQFSSENDFYLVTENEFEVLESGYQEYHYFEYCFMEGKLLDYSKYTDREYASDIRDFERYLSGYNKRNLFDSSYVEDLVAEDEDLFIPYDELDNNSDNLYTNLVETMYSKGKIPLTLKNQLMNIDEESYIQVVTKIRSSVRVSDESNEPNSDTHFVLGHSEYEQSVSVPRRDIEDWDSEYNTSAWLTESKLNELISKTDAELDGDELWNMYTGKSRYNYYEQYIYIPYCSYISYSQVLDILSDEDLNFSGKRKTKLNKMTDLLSTESNPEKSKEVVTYEKNIQRIKQDSFYRIASLLGKHINYDPKVNITLKDFKKIANSDKYLKRFLPTKEVNYLLNKFTKGFSIEDLKKIDIPSYEKGSLFEYLTEIEKIPLDTFLDVDIVSYKWKSSLQTITNKYNYVFQLNLKKEYLKKILEHYSVSDEIKINLNNYHKTKHTLHPVQNNDEYISLGWIRYTINPTIKYNNTTLEGVLLDEVQSDLDNFEYLGRDIMKGWQYIITRKFISYVKKNLGYNKIYMPTPDVKADEYGAFQREPSGEIKQKYTANLLYRQLPKSFAFAPSEIEGFNLLEKRIR